MNDLPDTTDGDQPLPEKSRSSKSLERQELEGILQRFSRCFIGDMRPDQYDLKRFLELIPILHLEIGGKKTSPDYFWNMFKAVDKRWVALHLCRSVEGMVTRFVKTAPQAPGLRLLRYLESQASGKTVDPKNGHPLFQFLNEPEVGLKAAKWTAMTADLDFLVSPEMGNALKTLAGPPEVVAWLKFLDVHRQAITWRLQHERWYNRFVQWVYALRNDDLMKLIETVTWKTGVVPTAEEWKEVRKQRLNRERQRKIRGEKKKSL